MQKNSDKKFRTLRLALSVCGEYTQYHGGTVAGALAAMNATLTRINGVYEKDFALHLNLQNYPNLIYTNANTDPYSATENGTANGIVGWNAQVQSVMTAGLVMRTMISGICFLLRELEEMQDVLVVFAGIIFYLHPTIKVQDGHLQGGILRWEIILT